MNYDQVSEGSENDLKYPITERVKEHFKRGQDEKGKVWARSGRLGWKYERFGIESQYCMIRKKLPLGTKRVKKL